jgi:LysR family glycine cleavage system transcriptional activator
MKRPLPPLNPLKAFEAAARHGSLTLAADELGVTQVAVSRQVRALEAYLAIPLFTRSHRRVELTREGAELLRAAGRAFDEIGSAVAALSRRGRRDLLTIQAYTTFSQRWLIPRLNAFHEAHPDIEVRLMASIAPVDFRQQPIDAAIRSGLGRWAGAEAERLTTLDLVPVCSPALLRGGPPLAAPADLGRHTLLYSMSRPDDWAAWLAAAGAGTVDPRRGLKFENSALAYEAALQGIGVAIGVRVLVERNLRDGLLATPLPLTHTLPGGYWLLWPADRRPSPSLSRFRDWLRREVAASATSSPDAGDAANGTAIRL